MNIRKIIRMIHTLTRSRASDDPVVSVMIRTSTRVHPGIHNGSSEISLNVFPAMRAAPMKKYRLAAPITASGRSKTPLPIHTASLPAHVMKRGIDQDGYPHGR